MLFYSTSLLLFLGKDDRAQNGLVFWFRTFRNHLHGVLQFLGSRVSLVREELRSWETFWTNLIC